MTDIDRLLTDLGLDVEVLHSGTGPRCLACAPIAGPDRLPAAA